MKSDATPSVSHLNREQSNDKGDAPYGECRSTAETVHGELGVAERSEKLFIATPLQQPSHAP